MDCRPANVRETTGRIFDLKRFAVHDGPGIRTVVFFKGCPLRCAWCHNPEAFDIQPELMVYAARCIGCGACLTACPHGAHQVIVQDGTSRKVHLRERCVGCGRCAETCYAEALVLLGRQFTVKEVVAVIRQDAAFYRQSGGGVTLSGGEPLMQPEFALALLRQCQAEGYHTALDTCGQAPWPVFEALLPHVDLVLYDLKHMDPQTHLRHTGVTNARIIENLRRLGAAGVPVEVRMPIIPTINDAREDVEQAAELLASLRHVRAVRLLPYHRLAGSKYQRLGRENTMPDVPPPTAAGMREIAAWLQARGLAVIMPE